MTLAAPDAAVLGKASSVAFEVTGAMIERFAALTGDRSSLHVSDAFARRSAYRRPVAHGMLPVAFLLLLRPFQLDGFRCRPVAISGQFLTPVFAGDSLELSTSPAVISSDAGQAEFEFRVEHAASRSTVTQGRVTVVYEPRRPWKAAGGERRDGSMVAEPLEVRSALLEEIEVGASDTTDFLVSDATIRDLTSLVKMGAPGEASSPQDLSEGCDLPSLLAVLLFSTSVGVRLPGASATFLEFSARFEKPIALDTTYRLRGTVTHRSRSTRIIKKEMLVAPSNRSDETVLQGKVATLVTKPAQNMPSMEELKNAGTDWGLAGKVVLVTGASRGIGETTAKLLALFGAKVVVNYNRGADDARRVVDEITSGGGDAAAIAADVSDAAQVRSLVEQARERYGAVDILVNNAARDFRPIPFMSLTWDEIQKDIDVIAKGAFLCCQAVIPLMLEQGSGKIINISTVATDNPPPDQTKYVMAKSALVGLTRSLSIELASRNIQVNLVVPNFVETDFVAHIQEGFRKKIAQDTPMKRNASPIDVARAVVFLASSHSSFTTGQKLMVTGGGAPYV